LRQHIWIAHFEYRFDRVETTM